MKALSEVRLASVHGAISLLAVFLLPSCKPAAAPVSQRPDPAEDVTSTLETRDADGHTRVKPESQAPPALQGVLEFEDARRVGVCTQVSEAVYDRFEAELQRLCEGDGQRCEAALMYLEANPVIDTAMEARFVQTACFGGSEFQGEAWELRPNGRLRVANSGASARSRQDVRDAVTKAATPFGYERDGAAFFGDGSYELSREDFQLKNGTYVRTQALLQYWWSGESNTGHMVGLQPVLIRCGEKRKKHQPYSGCDAGTRDRVLNELSCITKTTVEALGGKWPGGGCQ